MSYTRYITGIYQSYTFSRKGIYLEYTWYILSSSKSAISKPGLNLAYTRFCLMLITARAVPTGHQSTQAGTGRRHRRRGRRGVAPVHHFFFISKPSYYYDTIIHIMTSVIRVNRVSLIPIMTILSHYFYTIMTLLSFPL